MAFLHEHRRRVPTQDHLCRIGVSGFKVAAACADKARLVLQPDLADKMRVSNAAKHKPKTNSQTSSYRVPIYWLRLVQDEQVGEIIGGPTLGRAD
ncbi:hypothetical protein LX82_02700 [Celeribacter halophilus]|uniref:Uncharacterized protein n=1 Tax=Celeribacter halophilus TaxID=576117 RepID=A0A1I3W5A6_9RHOB|nr:hypothetical protein LX82_02700 [Celeribacter halophilus]SFK01601.1 hypothetical protein SAMN04488138_1203 [Celeribacter halophilus]